VLTQLIASINDDIRKQKLFDRSMSLADARVNMREVVCSKENIQSMVYSLQNEFDVEENDDYTMDEEDGGSEWIEQDTFSEDNVKAEEFVPGKFVKVIPLSEANLSDDASSLGSNQCSALNSHREQD